MSPFFKKMHRYEIRCHFCNKTTDCLAYDREDANKRFNERGWQGEEVLSTPEEEDVFAALGLEWVEPEKREII